MGGEDREERKKGRGRGRGLKGVYDVAVILT